MLLKIVLPMLPSLTVRSNRALAALITVLFSITFPLDGPPPHLLAHYMPWFGVRGTPTEPGEAWRHWKWDGPGARHDPEQRLPEISSTEVSAGRLILEAAQAAEIAARKAKSVRDYRKALAASVLGPGLPAVLAFIEAMLIARR